MKYGKWILLVAAYTAAFAANVGYFWWSWEIGALQTAATVLYLAVCAGVFWMVRQHSKHMKRAMVCSALTAAAGGIGLLIRVGLTELTLPGILLAGVFVTPLYGLTGWFSDFDAGYAAVAVWGLAWMLVSRYFRNRSKA